MATKAASSMEDTASSVGSSPPKKVTSTKAVDSKPKSTHPTTGNMIMEAINQLGERGGSSLFAIKKYMTETYKVDTDKLAFYIKKFLKSAVESGQLIQTKGKGASGSFKLPPKSKSKAKEVQTKAGSSKTSLDNKKAATKKASKAAASAKPASPKKKQASSAKVAKKASTETVKKSKTAKTDPKSPKAKRSARSPTKLKAPKAKKVADKSPKPSTSRKAVTAK